MALSVRVHETAMADAPDAPAVQTSVRSSSASMCEAPEASMLHVRA